MSSCLLSQVSLAVQFSFQLSLAVDFVRGFIMVIFNPPSFCLITAVFAVSALAESYPPWRGFNLLSSGVSISPLEWLGANGQWFPGPDVNGISSDVPDGCTVEQAAYVVRHGSRYPDSSAYMEWTNLSAKVSQVFIQESGALNVY